MTKSIVTQLLGNISNISPEKRTLLEYLLKKEGLDPYQLLPIPCRKEREHAPLSFAQQRLWFIDQFLPGNPVYNIPIALCVVGALNLTALEQSLSEILRRHEALRTVIINRDGQPVQSICPPPKIVLHYYDYRHLPREEREVEASRMLTEQASQPFDLGQGPLLRASILQLDQEEHLLMFLIHHIVTDGWSMGIFVRELVTLYDAFCAGQPSPLSELPIQYADFAVWQREWLQGEVLEKQLGYWRELFVDGVPVLELPTDKPRPTVQTFNAARIAFQVSNNVCKGLKILSQQEESTLFMVLLAGWQTLLHRYSGQDLIVVGTDMANRNRVETEGLIGFFVNMLVMKGDLSGNPSFLEFLARVRKICLDAYAHQDLPFERLVEELQPERDLSRPPLFQVVFVLQNAPLPDLELAGLKLSVVDVNTARTPFEIILSMSEIGESLEGRMLYNTDLFSKDFIENMICYFQRLLERIVNDPTQRLSDLPLLSESERHQLLYEWNETSREYPQECIHRLFEAQAAVYPDAVAVVYGEHELSYRELNARANQLARHLRSLGVGLETPVGVCLERSLEMVIGLLAILKAGGAYLPLDAEYPLERLAFMLEDAQIPILLTQESLLDRLPVHWGQVVCLDSEWAEIAGYGDENLEYEVEPDNLAYIIYTSGSTGIPKGIEIQ
ncbi:MAG: condensation domain-containing protein, partial [Acidobacteriota bacterium]